MLMIGSCGRSILPLRACVVVRDLLDFGLYLIILILRLRLMFGLGPFAPPNKWYHFKMVGIPRPRGACNTCRSRKIKCDQFKPSCKKCTNSQHSSQTYYNAVFDPNSEFQSCSSLMRIRRNSMS
ncbi:hypothetical protein F5X98DRAFT_292488 [Xylaria grammica]|nr:hypothetical protein F5X98DRAFT_292488 [Xylaria grammica]